MACDAPVHYRRATVADAEGIARVNADGWLRAHAGLVPEEYLRCRAARGHAEFWRSELELEAADRKPWLALAGDEVIGFADGGIARDDDLDGACGEVYTLFVTPECWEKGIRSRLLEHVAKDLRSHDFRRGVFWVLASDQVMRAFARYVGWHEDGVTRERACGDASVTEVRYAREFA